MAMSVSVYVIRLNTKQNLDRNIYRVKKENTRHTIRIYILFATAVYQSEKKVDTQRRREEERERER